MHWDASLTDELLDRVKGNEYWSDVIKRWAAPSGGTFSVHLAVFVEPYLQYVIDEKKTIESRFSVVRFAPYMRVEKGDIILLKRTGGPIVGLCEVNHVWFYHLDVSSWTTIRRDFAEALCAQDPSFWEQRAKAEYATLMRIHHVFPIEPFFVPKHDRRGWVVLTCNNRERLDTLPGL